MPDYVMSNPEALQIATLAVQLPEREAQRTFHYFLWNQGNRFYGSRNDSYPPANRPPLPERMDPGGKTVWTVVV